MQSGVIERRRESLSHMLPLLRIHHSKFVSPVPALNVVQVELSIAIEKLF